MNIHLQASAPRFRAYMPKLGIRASMHIWTYMLTRSRACALPYLTISMSAREHHAHKLQHFSAFPCSRLNTQAYTAPRFPCFSCSHLGSNLRKLDTSTISHLHTPIAHNSIHSYFKTSMLQYVHVSIPPCPDGYNDTHTSLRTFMLTRWYKCPIKSNLW